MLELRVTQRANLIPSVAVVLISMKEIGKRTERFAHHVARQEMIVAA